MSARPAIICGFPGVGKSYLTQNLSLLPDYRRLVRREGEVVLAPARNKILYDSDSSAYDKSKFPQNYLADIHHVRMAQPNALQLISTHKAVLQGLQELRLPHLLVYPNTALKEYYIQSYIDRGSPEAFVDHMVSNWDKYLADLNHHSKYCAFAQSVEFFRPEQSLGSYFGGPSRC